MKGKLFNRLGKGIVATALSVVIAAGTVSTALAEADTPIKYENYGFTAEKISNPLNGQREVDGLTPGGDRSNSYAWAMAERDDCIYIGTNRNIAGGTVVYQFIQMLSQAGVSEDVLWALVDAVANGDIPHNDPDINARILKYNTKTGEMKELAQIDGVSAYRMANTYNGNIYFGTFGSVAAGGTRIIKVDENDNVETVFTAMGDSSFRASTVYNGDLYFGGLDSRIEIPEGENYKKVAILKKDRNDDTVWTRVADYRDFIDYADDNVYAEAGGTVWDLIEYQGDMYVFLATSNGFVVFKGHEAENGENANEYGWTWQEVVGKNSKYNMGMAPTAEGYPTNGAIASAATPVVYKDKLYFGTFDNSFNATMAALTGLFTNIAGGNNTAGLSTYLKPMYDTIFNPQKMYCMDKDGVITECSEINEIFADTLNDYFWRYCVYNDKLYITSFDSKSIYNYFTRFTNGDILNMTPEEFESQINYIKNLVNVIAEEYKNASGGTGELDLGAILNELKDRINNMISGGSITQEQIQAIIDYINTLIEQIKNNLGSIDKEQLNQIIDKLKELSSNFAANAQSKINELIEQLKNLTGDTAITQEQLQQIIDRIKEYIGTLDENAKAKLDEFLKALDDFKNNQGNIDIDKLKEIAAAIQEKIQGIIDKAKTDINALIEKLKEYIPQTVDANADGDVSTGLQEKLNALFEKLGVTIDEETKAKISQIIELAKNIKDEQGNYNIDNIKSMLDLIKNIVSDAKTTAKDNLDKIVQQLKQLISEQGAVVPENIQQIIDKFTAFRDGIADEEIKAKLNSVIETLKGAVDAQGNIDSEKIQQALNTLEEAAQLFENYGIEINLSIVIDNAKLQAVIEKLEAFLNNNADSFSEETAAELRGIIETMKKLTDENGKVDGQAFTELLSQLSELGKRLFGNLGEQFNKLVEKFKEIINNQSDIDTTKLSEILDKLYKSVSELLSGKSDKLKEEILAEIQENMEQAKAEINNILNSLGLGEYLDGIKTYIEAALKSIYEKLDLEGLKMYMEISQKIAANEAGFDMYAMYVDDEGNVSVETVTDNGFNDKYNYGGRTMVVCNDSLYLGTANPFYGAQLWKISGLATELPSKPDDDPSEGDDPQQTDPSEGDNPQTTDPSEGDKPQTTDPSGGATANDVNSSNNGKPAGNPSADNGATGSNSNANAVATADMAPIAPILTAAIASAVVLLITSAKKRKRS